MDNLYMTTQEFADLVIDSLDSSGYFKKGQKAHPEDIAVSFSSVCETISTTMNWAIKRSKTKNAVMETNNLSKREYHD